MVKQRLVILILLIYFLLPESFVLAGTILSSYKYAWGSNVGYVNFENAVVNDGGISGYAWSENSGWIKFNPAQGGVFNDGNGHLSGSAWGESLGWIDFSGVNISTSTGRFHGSATGDIVGVINFDCPNYCDVRTDWSVPTVSVSTPTPIPHSSGSSGSLYPTIMNLLGNPIHINSYNSPLILSPNESGTLTKDLSFGIATVDVPAGSLIDDTAFVVYENPSNSTNNFLSLSTNTLVNNFFYDITAVDRNGLPVHDFAKPLTISLPISSSQIALDDLKLYWLNEVNWKWVLIPDAVFVKGKVTFKVSHLTRFAIFYNTAHVKKESGGSSGSIKLPQDKKDLYTKSTSTNPVKVDFSNNRTTPKGGVLWFIILMIMVLISFIFKKKQY